MPWYGETMGLLFIETKRPSSSPCTKLYNWHTAVRQIPFFLTAKARLAHHMPDIEDWSKFVKFSREYVSATLDCGLLHTIASDATIDVRLGCSCLALETHSMMFFAHCLFCLNSGPLCTHPLTLLCDFTWPTRCCIGLNGNQTSSGLVHIMSVQ